MIKVRNSLDSTRSITLSFRSPCLTNKFLLLSFQSPKRQQVEFKLSPSSAYTKTWIPTVLVYRTDSVSRLSKRSVMFWWYCSFSTYYSLRTHFSFPTSKLEPRCLGDFVILQFYIRLSQHRHLFKGHMSPHYLSFSKIINNIHFCQHRGWWGLGTTLVVSLVTRFRRPRWRRVSGIVEGVSCVSELCVSCSRDMYYLWEPGWSQLKLTRLVHLSGWHISTVEMGDSTCSGLKEVNVSNLQAG